MNIDELVDQSSHAKVSIEIMDDKVIFMTENSLKFEELDGLLTIFSNLEKV